ncbi:MAG: hypothetical protein ACM3JB_11430 [Acidobacteriaceae bacterium]
MRDTDPTCTAATERALLEALSNSVRSATVALARSDVHQLQTETARQENLLQQLSKSFSASKVRIFTGGGDPEDRARDRQDLRAALALHVSVLGYAIQRSLRTVAALLALYAGAEGTYTAVPARRP